MDEPGDDELCAAAEDRDRNGIGRTESPAADARGEAFRQRGRKRPKTHRTEKHQHGRGGVERSRAVHLHDPGIKRPDENEIHDARPYHDRPAPDAVGKPAAEHGSAESAYTDD